MLAGMVMTQGDGEYRDDERAMMLALFRYGVIGPLVEQPSYAPGQVRQLVSEIASAMHYLPGTGPIKLSERTVYTWLSRFRRGGLQALGPKLRKDRGISRAISERLLHRAIELRKEQPERWTSTLIDILKREGAFEGETIPHRATLDRHLAQHAASRRQMRTLGQKRTIKMHFENFADLYVGDCYCQEVHSELGITPNEAIAEVEKKPISLEVARELFLVRADRQVHPHTGCVSVEGQKFVCESFLRGQKVTVRYDPNDLSSVVIFHHGKRVQRAFVQPLGGVPEPHIEPKKRAQQSVDYLALLREDFDRQLIEHARPLAYCELVVEPEFDRERFVEVLCELAGLKALPSVRRELYAFWDSFGPLPESLVRIATEHAVRLHTRGRHVRVYLHPIRTLVLAELKKPSKNERI